MAQLSQSERDIIEEYPLDDSLDRFRNVLREAEQSDPTSRPDTASKGPEKPRLFTAAMSGLLLSLLGTDAATNLPSKTGDEDLASDLLALRRRVQKGDYDYNHFRALSRLVIDSASDINIWSAVIDLVSSVARVTPPRSIAPSFDGIPITHSSASFQGKEQTRKLLEDALFWEIRTCTYRGVEGFFEKYFKGKRWSKRSKRIYNTVKKCHVDGRWTDFPDPPTEDDVWSWLSRFQDEVLTKSRNVMYRAKWTSDLTGTEPSRQIDIFLKHRSKARGRKARLEGRSCYWRTQESWRPFKARSRSAQRVRAWSLRRATHSPFRALLFPLWNENGVVGI